MELIMMKRTTLLKKYLTGGKILPMPVVHDALCAKIAEKAGFLAIAVGGYSSTASLLGKPDVSLLTLTEMAEYAGRIVNAVSIPVFADGDTGHGNVTNVIRTVQLFEKAGVAGLLLEDQVQPKRCGHMSGKQVIPAKEMVAKIKAALDTRVDPDLIIMARTDAIAVNGIDDAIKRANLYRDAGADAIFVEAPESLEQMKRITSEIDAPLMANMIPGGRTPLLSERELEEIGFAAVAYATICTYAITKSVTDLFGTLHRTGTLAGLEERMVDFGEFNSLVGLEEIRKKERYYYHDCDMVQDPVGEFKST
jgi:2-methylisocitrate lyase-like PEP mutase family enzyme